MIFNITALFGQVISKVVDINQFGSSNPVSITKYDNKLFFAANDSIHGEELWEYDAATNQTRMIKDINSSGSSQPRILGIYLNKIFFSADDGVHGSELWCSDGTTNGTFMLKDIDTNSNGLESCVPVELNNRLYFKANDGVHGAELWVTDGSTVGTKMFMDFDSVSFMKSGLFNTYELTVFNNKLVFSAFDGNQFNLWQSDGTVVGSSIISGWPIGKAQNFLVYNNELYFSGYSASVDVELWKTDLTTINLIKDINVSGSGKVHSLHEFNNKIYFSATDGVFGDELWSSDGTLSGTQMVKDIAVGNNTSQVGSFNVYNNKLYFTADQFTAGNLELWSSDGTSSGTIGFELNQTEDSYAHDRKVWKGKQYIRALLDSMKGFQLLAMDSTGSLIELNTPNPFANSADASVEFIEYNDELYFAADYDMNGVELYKITDSSVNSTSISEIFIPIELNLYPNPSSGNVNIDINPRVKGDIELHLFDYAGNRVLSKRLNRNSSISIDFSGYRSGIYSCIMLLNNEFVLNKRFVLSK